MKRNVRFCVYVLVTLLLMLTIACNGRSYKPDVDTITNSQKNLPSWVVDGLKQPFASKSFDKALLERDKLLAHPIDPGQLQQITVKNGKIVPPNFDYSQYITFTENQDGWGGCVGRSMMHVMNILNEMESSYTPDLSFWYLHTTQESLGKSTKYVLENWGVCPEANLPSDYDKATIANDVADFSTMPQPTAKNNAQADYYKVALLSDESYTPDVNAMKQAMLQYGPILVGGPLIAIQGPNPKEGHCVTVVGWSDGYYGAGKGAFKLLNSWGDKWNGNGFIWLKYSDLAANIDSWRYIQDGLSDRTGTKYAYSARIDLQGQAGAERNKLAVKIGAVGQDPWLFWDHPNHIEGHCYDGSQNLKIDIPLPDYAVDYWPPSDNNIWFIEVTNDNDVAVNLNEFTLAIQQGQNTLGKFIVQPYTYKPNVPVAVPGHTKQTFAIPHLAGITLQKPKNMHNGLLADSNQEITWTTAPPGVGNVSISYVVNLGYGQFNQITYAYNNGSYPWHVPDITTDKALVYVAYEVNGVICGEDNSGDFSIGSQSQLFKDPTDLKATVKGAWIQLTWSDNNQLEGVEYSIERKTENGSYSVIATVPQTSSYVDNTSSEKENYQLFENFTYRVRMTYGAETSNYSNEVTATADYTLKIADPGFKVPKLQLVRPPLSIRHELTIPKPVPYYEQKVQP